MDEIRTREGGEGEKEPLRKLINERDGLARVTRPWAALPSRCRFILKLQIICLWTERVIPTSPPLPFFTSWRVRLWQSWLESILAPHSCDCSLHPPSRPQSPVTKMKLGLTPQLLAHISSPSFFLWALVSHWDLSLGFVSHSLSTSLTAASLVPQIASQSSKDKCLVNYLTIKDIGQTYSLTSLLSLLYSRLCALHVMPRDILSPCE